MAAKKIGGLGAGLGAFFEDVNVNVDDVISNSGKNKRSSVSEKNPTTGKKAEGESAANSVVFLNINDLMPNADQPRKAFAPEKITELADSIKEHGIIQPIMVRPKEVGYEIVAGERRWRAAREAGLSEVPCLVRELSEEQNMLFALIENVQREDLNAIEEAEAIEKMTARYGMTQEQVSKSIGKSRPYVTNSLRLLKLPDEIKTMVSEGELSGGHARALAGIKDKNRQITTAKAAVAGNWSVREIEDYIGESRGKSAGAKAASRAKAAKRREKNNDVLRIEEELKETFGTKVNLVMGSKRGKIEIEYYSRDELERLLEILLSARS